MPSDRLRRIALIVWTAVGAVALGYVILIIAGSIRVIWLPIAFGAGIVFLLEPVVRAFERMRMPRPVAAVLALLAMIAMVLAIFFLVLPTIRQQAAEVGERLPDLYLAGINWIREIGGNLGLNVDELLSQEAIEQWLNDPANKELLRRGLRALRREAAVLRRLGPASGAPSSPGTIFPAVIFARSEKRTPPVDPCWP